MRVQRRASLRCLIPTYPIARPRSRSQPNAHIPPVARGALRMAGPFCVSPAHRGPGERSAPGHHPGRQTNSVTPYGPGILAGNLDPALERAELQSAPPADAASGPGIPSVPRSRRTLLSISRSSFLPLGLVGVSIALDLLFPEQAPYRWTTLRSSLDSNQSIDHCWSAWQDSNLRSLVPKTSALAARLHADVHVVGEAGLEPAISCIRNRYPSRWTTHRCLFSGVGSSSPGSSCVSQPPSRSRPRRRDRPRGSHVACRAHRPRARRQRARP